MESEVMSNVFTNDQTSVIEEECVDEEEIRNAVDKALDEADALDEWEEENSERENINPQGNQEGEESFELSQGPPSCPPSPTAQRYNHCMTLLHDNHSPSHKKQVKYPPNINGQWAMLQQPPPHHPYLKSQPMAPLPIYSQAGYPPPGMPYPMQYPQYNPFPPPRHRQYESEGDSSENNTEFNQCHDEYNSEIYQSNSEYTNNPRGQSPDFPSVTVSESLQLDDEEGPPEQIYVLYRANQKQLETLKSQFETCSKQVHNLQHTVGMLQSEKGILESQLSQTELKTRQLEDVADRERLCKEEEIRNHQRKEQQMMDLELELQSVKSENEKLSYQLRDTVPRKESNFHEQMVAKVKSLSQQQTGELKRKLDDSKRELNKRSLEVEKLKNELQHSVKDKMTSLEQELITKEEYLRQSLVQLVLTLPKINLVDVKMPLVTELECADTAELTAHIALITDRLCSGDVGEGGDARTLVSRIEDLTIECDTLRQTAAELENRVVSAERAEMEVTANITSRERSIASLHLEISSLHDQVKDLHSSVNTAERRADTAQQQERVVLDKLAECERAKEQLLTDHNNTHKKLVGAEERGRLSVMTLEKRLEEARQKEVQLEHSLHASKEQYLKLSQRYAALEQDKSELQDSFRVKLSTSNTEAALQCEREVRTQCEREEEERWRMKEDELLDTFAFERQQIEASMEQKFEQRLSETVASEIELAQKQWSGHSHVSTLYNLEMAHKTCQTDNNSHFSKIWEKERELELSMARETAVAIAKAAWHEEHDRLLQSRLETLVRCRKDEWLASNQLSCQHEAEGLKLKLKEAVQQTEAMKNRVEEEYKDNLSRTKLLYKEEIEKVMQREKERHRALEMTIEELRQTLDRSEEALSSLKRDKKRGEELTRAEIEKLHSLCNELSVAERSLQEKLESSELRLRGVSEEFESARQRCDQQISQVKQQSEQAMTKMREELVKFATSANEQALAYVTKSITDIKDSTAYKYKKYYQKLLYCIVEKHPNTKATIKHLQQTLPRTVPAQPSSVSQSSPHLSSQSPHLSSPTPSNHTYIKPKPLLSTSQLSHDSGLPSSQFISQQPMTSQHSQQPIRAQSISHMISLHQSGDVIPCEVSRDKVHAWKDHNNLTSQFGSPQSVRRKLDLHRSDN